MFIAALFIIARTWKKPRCPSADKCIKKLWYTYTMEYYSAIEKDTFESVLVRWIVVFFTDWGLVDRNQWKERGNRRERETAVSLRLCGKPIKPMHKTCTTHEDTGLPLKEVLKAWVRKWARQASMLQREWRQKEGHRGPRSLVEQGYFISRNVGLYIFSKMITQLLQRMKSNQLQQNG